MNPIPPHCDDLLHDLPPLLRRAVHEAVASCQPHYRPRLYACDWQQELYHEAAQAAWEAWQSYHPDKGALYDWGVRIVRQRLGRFCDRVWAAARWECAYPCDETTGEELEVEDAEALAAIEEHVLCSQVREALGGLSEGDRQLVEWYFGDGLSKRAIAARLGCSHVAVHRRLRRVWGRLCAALGVEREFPSRRGEKSAKSGEKGR